MAFKKSDIAYVGEGAQFALPAWTVEQLREWVRGPLVLQKFNNKAELIEATQLQIAPLLDDIFAAAQTEPQFGVTVAAKGQAQFKLWAPTAQFVSLCVLQHNAQGKTIEQVLPMQRNAVSGVWSVTGAAMRGALYRFAVQVHVPGLGW